MDDDDAGMVIVYGVLGIFVVLGCITGFMMRGMVGAAVGGPVAAIAFTVGCYGYYAYNRYFR